VAELQKPKRGDGWHLLVPWLNSLVQLANSLVFCMTFSPFVSGLSFDEVQRYTLCLDERFIRSERWECRIQACLLPAHSAAYLSLPPACDGTSRPKFDPRADTVQKIEAISAMCLLHNKIQEDPSLYTDSSQGPTRAFTSCALVEIIATSRSPSLEEKDRGSVFLGND
jgi:hypothetical protein